jgi:hypothetical protein
MDTDGHRWKSVIRELRELRELFSTAETAEIAKAMFFVSFALFGPKHYFFLVGM